VDVMTEDEEEVDAPRTGVESVVVVVDAKEENVALPR
jgi:hypothetical protein